MTTEFKLPELGENIESANVVKILVAVGDKIEKDQPVMELETDKATIELPSSVSGTVSKILVQEGGKASVGEVVLTVESDGAKQKPTAEAKKAVEPTPPAKEKAKESSSEVSEKKEPGTAKAASAETTA